MKSLCSWKNDVAVLLIFFVRSDVFEKTFAAVKEARPRKLLLFQDGPRKGRLDDIKEMCNKKTFDIKMLSAKHHRQLNELF